MGKKKIFIAADCFLAVFELLPPRQLGLGIALISHRFDYYVDEHFKTRKWALKLIRIEWENGKNCTKKMQIVVNSSLKSLLHDGKVAKLPIPQIQVPRKVSGFEHIIIFFIDRDVIAFLHRFRQLFAACPINLAIRSDDGCVLEFILRNIWPMLAKNIHVLKLSFGILHLHCIRSILDDCPALRIVTLCCAHNFFTKFPADESAMASDGQAVAKWLFTARPDNLPKVLKCDFDMDDEHLPFKLEACKTAFINSSSPANFIAVIWFSPSFVASVVPFVLINEMTREQLVLKRIDDGNERFLLVRCPIARDASKWAKWEKEATGWKIYAQWNRISIQTEEYDIGRGLLDTMIGPSDQQQQK